MTILAIQIYTMKKLYYPAIFSKEKEYYNVSFIDFNETTTFGEELEGAYKMGQDLLSLLVEENINDLPKPTLEYSKIKLEKGEFISLIELDLEEYNKSISDKYVKVTLTIPEWLKYIANKKEISLSKLLKESVIAKVEADIHGVLTK